MVIPKQYRTSSGRLSMEHNPFITLNDDTEMTHSDLKKNEYGQEYITIYFETPAGGDLGYAFCDASIDYPISNGEFCTVNHYTKEQLNTLLYFYNKLAPIAFELIKEDLSTQRENIECHNF